ncbi:MAG: SH3 domain-containing protein [Burkholderiales bacterium]|nr:SH3 domain-containing protein [Pseudomonadota bacterium]
MFALARHVLVAFLLAFAGQANAAPEFRSVTEDAAVTYDAPSLRARKLSILSRGYPLEIVVSLAGWVKVRDANGELAWVENKAIGEKRSVLVRVPIIDVREAANDKSAVVFRAEQNVVLDFIEYSAPGWAKVAHRDGQSGYVRTSQVWGV